ncbi:MAG TPA: hypothetical protein VJ723_16300, partial [Candidatus Angelobacter sp.]|nr:hypothetical protein [Candidatus Angelobacter sp.]
MDLLKGEVNFVDQAGQLQLLFGYNSNLSQNSCASLSNDLIPSIKNFYRAGALITMARMDSTDRDSFTRHLCETRDA